MNTEGWNVYEGETIGARVVYRGVARTDLRGVVFAYDLVHKPHPCGGGYHKVGAIIKADPGQEYIDPLTGDKRVTDDHTFFVNYGAGAMVTEAEYAALEASSGR